MLHDVPEIGIATGAHIGNAWFGTPTYQASLWSNMFGGMAEANQQGQATAYFLNVNGNMFSFGLLGLYQAGQAGGPEAVSNTLGQYVGGGLVFWGIGTGINSFVGGPVPPGTVSHWGSPGLQTGSWVMKGGVTPLNYVLSGKYQPVFNQFARYGTGKPYVVAPSTLTYPAGIFGWAKGAIGQRMYNGPCVPPAP
jgi:hypothetical protein